CRLLLIRTPVRCTRRYIGIYGLPPITHLARFERLQLRPVPMRTICLLSAFVVTALLPPATRPCFVFLGLGPDLTRSGIAALPVRPLRRLARIAGTDAVRRIDGFGIMRLGGFVIVETDNRLHRGQLLVVKPAEALVPASKI